MLTITSGEELILLSQACRLVPAGRGANVTHLSTLLRWILTGAKSPDGTRVYLEAIRVGSKWATSREALDRFFAALTPRLHDAEPVTVRTTSQRERAAAQAAKILERAGI